MDRLPREFFTRDILELAPDLLGAKIVVLNNGKLNKFFISEVEAYRGEEDLACHASKGRTKRTEIMYNEGGFVYVYLIYGIYWLLNIVTGEKNIPQAALIRGVTNCNGPGRVGRLLSIDSSYYGEDLCTSSRIWLEKSVEFSSDEIVTKPRIGIDYAGSIWANKPWRYILSPKKL